MGRQRFAGLVGLGDGVSLAHWLEELERRHGESQGSLNKSDSQRFCIESGRSSMRPRSRKPSTVRSSSVYLLLPKKLQACKIGQIGGSQKPKILTMLPEPQNSKPKTEGETLSRGTLAYPSYGTWADPTEGTSPARYPARGFLMGTSTSAKLQPP